MPERRMKAALRRTLGAAPTPRPGPAHRDRLESTLVEAWRDRYPLHRRWLMLLNPWNRAARLAMAGLAVALLGVGACSTSTTTEVEMGQKLTIAVSAGQPGGKAEADLPALEAELNRFFSSRPAVEGVNFNVMGRDGQVVFEVAAWGQDLDAATLESDLRAAVPALGDANVAIEPLNGTVRENLLAHLGHEYLGLELEVDGATADEIRAGILAQMAAAGIDGDAEVQVEDTPDGRRTIKVEVRGPETH